MKEKLCTAGGRQAIPSFRLRSLGEVGPVQSHWGQTSWIVCLLVLVLWTVFCTPPCMLIWIADAGCIKCRPRWLARAGATPMRAGANVAARQPKSTAVSRSDCEASSVTQHRSKTTSSWSNKEHKRRRGSPIHRGIFATDREGHASRRASHKHARWIKFTELPKRVLNLSAGGSETRMEWNGTRLSTTMMHGDGDPIDRYLGIQEAWAIHLGANLS